MLTFYPSRILNPGVKKALDPGSRIPQHCMWGTRTNHSGSRTLAKLTCDEKVQLFDEMLQQSDEKSAAIQ
jgi:hypothetical protein